MLGEHEETILVLRAHDPSGLWQESRALARPDFLSISRVSVSYYQPIRFARFDGKSVKSQSSRFLPQARRIVGSGDENDNFKDVTAAVDASCWLYKAISD